MTAEDKSLPSRRARSLANRVILSAGAWLALGLIAGGLMLSYLFRDAVERSFDARLDMLMDNLIGAANEGSEGMVSLYRSMMDPRFDRPYSGWYWQIGAKGEAPFRSRSLWDQELPSDFSKNFPREHYFHLEGPEGQHLRAITRDVRLPGVDHVHRFIIAGDTSEVENDIAAFNTRLVWWLLSLGILLLATMAIQVRFGLRPLKRIGVALAAIRNGASSRLEGDFPQEIMPLVTETNALLDHNAAVVERAQKHVGNLAHALKTPLTVVANEAAAGDGPLAEVVRRQADVMRRHIDHHLVRARAAGRGSVIGSRAEVLPAVRDLMRAMERIYADRHLSFEVVVDGSAALAFKGDRQDLDEILGNVLDNAGKWAARRVVVTIAAADGRVAITIDDDGPGIPAKDRDMVFARGERMDESVPGSGLGLGIVRDLTALCGGSVALDTSPLGGLRVKIDLPSAS